MTIETWYPPEHHQRFPVVPDLDKLKPTDIEGIYEATQQRHREREVKLAHFRIIKEKLERCYLYHGMHNFRQHCRFLMEEFMHTKDELLGWKEDKRLIGGLPFAGKHYDPPAFREPERPETP